MVTGWHERQRSHLSNVRLPVGSYSFQAIYSGDQNDNPSKSAVLTQVVTLQPVAQINVIENVGTGWPTVRVRCFDLWNVSRRGNECRYRLDPSLQFGRHQCFC